MPETIDHWSAEPDLPALKHALKVRDRNPAEALTLFRALASAGSPMSMIYIGHAYQEGNGTSKDLAETERWYRSAADAGSIWALHALGCLYLMQKRYDEGKHSFRFAAAAGFSPAIYQLGRMYFFGKGVERDVAKAKVHLEDASALGNVWATRLLGHLLIRTHLNAMELLRGVFLRWVRPLFDALVVLCIEGMDSDKLSE